MAMSDVLFQNRKFFDALAAKYDHPLIRFWMKRFHTPVLRKIEHGSSAKGKGKARARRRVTILDIGCGTGELLRELSARGEDALYGVDLSRKMLEMARRKLPRNVILQEADVRHLPFPRNTFDYVVTTETFHHYPHQKKALAEMIRVAKNNGSIIVVDIDFGAKLLHSLFAKIEKGCVRINTKEEMRKLFADARLHHITQKRSFGVTVMTIGVKPKEI